MRVLFLTYDNPFTGGSGVSVYCRDVFSVLVERGISVGAAYIEHRDWRFRPYWRTSQANNISLFALANSPLHPEDSIYTPIQDARQPTIESLLRTCFLRFRPDILHVQSLQGFPGAILSIAKELGIRSVVMLHDFWALCPRLGLMRLRGEPCEGPNGGLNCVQFCVQPRPWRQRLYLVGTRLPEGRCRDAFLAARTLYFRYFERQNSPWTPTQSAPTGTDGHLLAQHAARSAFLLRALGEADQLLAVSEFVKSVFVRHGISASKIRTLAPTLAVGRQVGWKAHRVNGARIRFGVLGRVSPMKGTHVLAEAVRGIPNDRAQVLVFGLADPEERQYLQGLAGETRLEFRGTYARHELASIFDAVDVVVIPSVVQETVGLVTLEAQAAGVPVIASRVGAIPEYVRDGENGFLFMPGDARDLREKMLRFVENPSLIAALSERTHLPMSLEEHVDRLTSIYRTCLAVVTQS